MIDNIFILAGGAGTRLWPASVRAFPKQFMSIKGGKSLIRLTLERAAALKPKGKVIIITLKEQQQLVEEECRDLPELSGKIAILPEPAARNTAPAIAAGASFLAAQGAGEETILVLPADHLINPVQAFISDTEKADILARKDYLVTFGIPPEGPETGYGYIEAGSEPIQEGGISAGIPVNSFREKPDAPAAEKFLAAGNYFWNSGMFAFKASRYLEELELHSGDIAAVFKSLKEYPEISGPGGISVIMDSSEVAEQYASAPGDSIDYAVMEHCSRTAMVRGTFTWNDIGSWDAFLDEADTGSSGVFTCGAENISVYSDLPVAVVGVDDVAVVVKNGKVLVCRRGRTQDVKKIVNSLKEQDRNDLL